MLASDFVTQTKAAIAQITDPDVSLQTVDLSTCDREAIHIPNAIQPHGVMLVCREDSPLEWIIVQVSNNTQQHLGQSPEALIGKPLSVLLAPEQLANVQACLDGDFDAVNPLRFDLSVNDVSQAFSGVVHRSDALVLLEIEPVESHDEVSFFDFHRLVKRPIERLRQTQTLAELCQVAVEELKAVTGFERVMVYELAADGSGYVIAEDKGEESTPYLGLRYPATDIPQQAKYLYLLNLLRLIPDVNYEPVSLVSLPDVSSEDSSEAFGDAAEGAVEKAVKKTVKKKVPVVDMSLSMLRSVSPLHTEYLRNMGVRATLAISLVHNNELWGLLVCHHNEVRQLSYERRTICEFLGQAISLELAAKLNSEDVDYQLKLKALQVSFVKSLSQSDTLKEGLTGEADKLLGLTSSTGVAFCEKGEITLLGQTPGLQQTQALVDWLSGQFEQKALYETSALSQHYPPAETFAAQASGLLAVAISHAQQLYIVWFRPEVMQTVNWAGNPNEKKEEVGEDGEIRLSPRRSFDLWKETVSGQCLPWSAYERETALELRAAVISVVLQRADELAELNLELERSNTELDSFAYIASHDLKEPLRGIHNYSSFLIEDYGEVLGEDGAEKLNTLMRLTQRMEDLISSLLHYSRLGRAELLLAPVDLNELVDGVIDLVNMSQRSAVSFEVEPELPVIECDRTQITELFTNLVTNAIKYNDKAEKRIEIGCLSGSDAIAQGISPNAASSEGATGDRSAISLLPTARIFYVRDNGIGIREKHIESVFRIFKRLHAPTRFGGGTGAGLTIAKKIVERHGGSIWIDSTYGEGTTFYFTLSAA